MKKPVRPSKSLRNTLRVIAARRDREKDLRNDTQLAGEFTLRRFDSLKGPLAYEEMFAAIKDFFGLGKLRNAQVVEFGAAESNFCSFLSKQFGANASEARRLAQKIDLEFPGRKFDLIIGNAVFEKDAFDYVGQGTNTFMATSKQAQKREAARKTERTEILKMFAQHLKPGGKILATGISSKVIFRPNEIAKVGLKIERDNLRIGRLYFSVYSKAR